MKTCLEALKGLLRYHESALASLNEEKNELDCKSAAVLDKIMKKEVELKTLRGAIEILEEDHEV